MPRDQAFSVPDEWGIGKSENGWNGKSENGLVKHFTNLLPTFKWITKMEIQRPVILYIDGHLSHLILYTSKFCAENGNILVVLYPNATHLLQPMGVAVFRSLKVGWKDAVHQWRIDHCDPPIIRKIHFCSLLKKVLTERIPQIFLKMLSKNVDWFPGILVL